MLIMPADAFNAASRLPVILPITHGGDFARRLGFSVTLSGTKTTGVVRYDQPRMLDIQARGGRKIDARPPEVMDDVMARLATIFK